MHNAHGLIANAIIHNLSLAVAYGGPAFARPLRTALLQGVSSDKERGKAMQIAWSEFAKIDVPAHLAFTATWLVERSAIKRYHGDAHTKNLVNIKDALIVGTLATGVANAVAANMMNREFPEGAPFPAEGNVSPEKAAKLAAYAGFFRVVGTLNRALAGASIATSTLIGASIIRSMTRGPITRLFRR